MIILSKYTKVYLFILLSLASSKFWGCGRSPYRIQVWGNKGENSVLCRVEGGWHGVGIGELI